MCLAGRDCKSLQDLFLVIRLRFVSHTVVKDNNCDTNQVGRKKLLNLTRSNSDRKENVSFPLVRSFL